MSTLVVTCNDDVLDTFESGTITLSMADAVNTFDLESVVQPEPGMRRVKRGDRVQVAFDHGSNKGLDVVIDGYVDATYDRDTPEALTFRFAGRSAAQDLVDCTATSLDTHGAKPKKVSTSWKGATLDLIVSDLSAPFSVETFVERPSTAFKGTFAVEPSENVMSAIQRLAMLRGLVVYSVGGDLVLARAGTTRTNTVLSRGRNVVEWEFAQSDYNRFSEYRVYTQSRPTDDNWGKATSQQLAIVKDPEIKRYRPLAIHAEGVADGTDLQRLGTLQRNLRMGQGKNLTAHVIGWSTDEGYAWRPNTLVHVNNYVLGIDADLLVTTARFRFGPNEPQSVQLELTRPEAFDTEALYEEVEKEEAARSAASR